MGGWQSPTFGPDRAVGATDLNDLAQGKGLEAVRQAIAAAAAPGTYAGESSPGERGELGEMPRGRKSEGGANGGRAGAKKVKVGPKGGDSAGPGAKPELLARASKALMIGIPQIPEYPVASLGPLADVTTALAAGKQVEVAIAGQSILTVAALLAQSKANVRSLDGVKPLSTYGLTIVDSGDGKTGTDTVAQGAVQERQKADARRYSHELEDYERAPKKDREPLSREPYRVAKDGTVEGIRRGFAQGAPSQAVFTSEAAAMLAGYGMAPEHRAKTAATFNGLWDDGEISVSRSTTGRIQLYDRRLSVHWLIQPAAVEGVLADPLLSSIGFWPRFLVAWPEPAGARFARLWRAEEDATVGAFWARCTAMMDGPIGRDCSGLPVLEPTPEALTLLGRFFERMEQAAKGPGATLADIKPFAVRATEQAVRVAGVLAEYDGKTYIDTETMRNGISLATYSLDTWREIFGDRDRMASSSKALKLFGWLLDQPEWTASETAMLRIGPKALRSQAQRDTALAVLEQVRLIYRAGRGIWTVEGG